MDKTWSDGEYLLGLRLRRKNVSYDDVALRLGRSIRAVRKKLGHALTAKPAVVHQEVAREALEGFVERMNAYPRDLTGFICGDPPAGFSELEMSEQRRLLRERTFPKLREVVVGEERPIRRLVLAARARAIREYQEMT